MTFTVTAINDINSGSIFAEILPKPEYTSIDYTISQTFVRTPYNETVWTHEVFTCADLHKSKWGLLGGFQWFEWHASSPIEIYTPVIVPIGPAPAPNEFQSFANWDSVYEWEERYISAVYRQTTLDPNPPSFALYNTLPQSPDLDLGLYRLITGLASSPNGTPCPVYLTSYNIGGGAGFNVSGQGTVTPGANFNLYPAPNIGFASSETACWIYGISEAQWFVESSFVINSVLPPPPSGPKFNGLWAEVGDLFIGS
jgi:hypothetical protein